MRTRKKIKWPCIEETNPASTTESTPLFGLGNNNSLTMEAQTSLRQIFVGRSMNRMGLLDWTENTARWLYVPLCWGVSESKVPRTRKQPDLLIPNK